ncbi:hypothetical protein UFOVP111_131 [uncultured Caudovirales phage]|uniref:Uncharacterized protein n=1 Tax=uncultured Caudovirales phage TaxID=2100421 RepID=A0A6J5L3A3_9CAUD|nr:hypothetical protein UFOVP111_131 [uncultured Caudovirales phage]
MKWNEKALGTIAGATVAGGVAGSTLGASNPGVALAAMGAGATIGAVSGLVASRVAKSKADKANKHAALGRQWNRK